MKRSHFLPIFGFLVMLGVFLGEDHTLALGHLRGIAISADYGGVVVPAVAAFVFSLVCLRASLIGVLALSFVTWTYSDVSSRGVACCPSLLIPVAAVLAVALAPRWAATLAFTIGTLGTLIGGDLLNLHAIVDENLLRADLDPTGWILPLTKSLVIGGGGHGDAILSVGLGSAVLAWGLAEVLKRIQKPFEVGEKWVLSLYEK